MSILKRQTPRGSGDGSGGFTLTEIMIAMTIMVILITMSVPIYSRAMEQARLDTASRNLLTIWAAQRVYWLDEQRYAEDLATLQAMDLLSSKIGSEGSSLEAFYIYRVESADSDSFAVSATRNGSGKWLGRISVDQFGDLSGSINGTDGTILTPLPGG